LPLVSLLPSAVAVRPLPWHMMSICSVATLSDGDKHSLRGGLLSISSDHQPRTTSSLPQHPLPSSQLLCLFFFRSPAGLKLNKEVQRALEKEVGLLKEMRHPNIILFMGVVLDPAAVVTGGRRAGCVAWPCLAMLGGAW
jgi:hypothetical protein